jgi:hypothetical protein
MIVSLTGTVLLFSLLCFKPVKNIELLTVATASDIAYVAFKPVTT